MPHEHSSLQAQSVGSADPESTVLCRAPLRCPEPRAGAEHTDSTNTHTHTHVHREYSWKASGKLLLMFLIIKSYVI